MSVTMKYVSSIGFALLLSATAASAQVGGSDVPSDAKSKGTMQNGSSSTGMSKGEAMQNGGGAMEKGAMPKGGAMEKGNSGKM